MPTEAERCSTCCQKKKILASQLNEFCDALKPLAIDQTLLGRVSIMDTLLQQ